MILLALLPAFWFCSFANEGELDDYFYHLDKNHDQLVSFEEGKDLKDGTIITDFSFKYYDKDENGQLTRTEFLKLTRERKFFKEALKRGEFDKPDPKGHLKPFGGWKDPLPIDIIEGPISAEEFHEKYIHAHRPALFKGIEKNSIAFKKWDKEYLAEKFGDVQLKLEPKVEARGDHSAYTDVDIYHHRTDIKTYLKEMETKNIYAVSIIPYEMAKEVNIVPSILCGSRNLPYDGEYPHPFGHDWMTHILEADLWISDRRTRSQFHYDKENNMNCMYKGTKEWIFVDTRKYFDKISWVRGGRFKGENDLLNAGTDWVAIDPDAIDLKVNFGFQDMDYYKIVQEPGDCVFIPYSMLHQVTKTDNAFSVSASYMWEPWVKYDHEACKNAPFSLEQPPQLPLSVMDVLWHFTGQGAIPQGNDDIINVRGGLFNWLEDRNIEIVNIKHILKYLLQNDISSIHNRSKWHLKKLKEMFLKLRNYFDDEIIRTSGLETFETVGIEFWLEFASDFEQESLPCNNKQRYYPRTKEEYKEMEDDLWDYLKSAYLEYKKEL